VKESFGTIILLIGTKISRKSFSLLYRGLFAWSLVLFLKDIWLYHLSSYFTNEQWSHLRYDNYITPQLSDYIFISRIYGAY